MSTSISNRKAKQIRRLASAGQSPAEIAKSVNLPVKKVEAFLGERKLGANSLAGIDGGRLVLLVTLFATVIVAPLLITKQLYNVANLPQSAFVQAMAALLTTGLLGYLAWRRESLRFSPFHLPLACFIVWAGLTGFWAINSYEFLYTWVHWLACVLIFFVACQTVPDRRWSRLLLEVLLWSGTVVALIGFLQHLLVAPETLQDAVKRASLWPPQIAPPSSTFANKNFAVHAVVPSFALGIGFFLSAKQTWRRWLYGGMTTVIATYMIYTGTRAGWVAAFVQLVAWGIFLVLRRRSLATGWEREKSLVLATCFACFLIFIHLSSSGFRPTIKVELERLARELNLIEELDRTTDNTAGVRTDTPEPYKPASIVELPPVSKVDTSASFAGRIKVWKNTLYLIRDHWLKGVGVGNFKIYFPLYDGRHDGIPMFDDKIQLSNTHNDYLQVWSDTGTIGMLLLGWLTVLVVVALVRLLRRDDRDLFLVAGIAVALIGMAVNALPSSPVQKSIPLLFAAILLAVLAGLYREVRPSRTWQAPVPLLATLSVIGLITTLGLWRVQVQRLKADHHYLIASAASKQQLWPRVQQEATQALAYFPLRIKSNAYLGKSHLELGEFDQAIRYFYRDLEGYPNSPNTLFDLGVTYAKRGNQHLTAVMRQQQAGDDAFAAALNDLQTALKYYLRVGDMLPAYSRLHNNIGALYMDYVRLYEYELQMANRQPESPEKAARVAELQEQRETNLQAALDEFRIEAGLNPTNDKVVFNLGIACMQAGKYQEAEEVLQITVGLRPQWALPHKNLGVLYLQHLNEPAKARYHFERALALDPNVEEAARIRQVISSLPTSEE